MMREYKGKTVISFLFLFLYVGISANNPAPTYDEKDKEKVTPTVTVTWADDQTTTLPRVFMIGEYTEEFEAASSEYRLQLLDACDGNMQQAYSLWMGMLQEMEIFADKLSYDLSGLKMWIKVFYNESGSIDHIAYYLKPHSKNVADIDELTAFFGSFATQYQFPLNKDEKFSNYGSASFPTMARLRATTTENRD